MSQSILIVGSEKFDGSVRHRLEQKGFKVSRVDELERAADLLTGSRVDLVILNLDEIGDGVGLIRRMRSIPTLTSTRVLAVGRWGTGQATVALSAGADAYEPPNDAERMVDRVERILNKRAIVVGMNK